MNMLLGLVGWALVFAATITIAVQMAEAQRRGKR